MRMETRNIVYATEDVILHQVNCQGKMGRGVARDLADKWPCVKGLYISECKIKKPNELLGSIQEVAVKPDLWVVNLFAQLRVRKFVGELCTNYKALDSCLKLVKERFPDKTIAIPYGMSCGLAGGDWGIVSGLIEKNFENEQITYYRWR